MRTRDHTLKHTGSNSDVENSKRKSDIKKWLFNAKKGFQPILDYVEGRMSVMEFQQMFETNKYLQKILKLPLDKKIYGAGNTTTIFSIFSVITMITRGGVGILLQIDTEYKRI